MMIDYNVIYKLKEKDLFCVEDNKWTNLWQISWRE
jgi:hypothetical protein